MAPFQNFEGRIATACSAPVLDDTKKIYSMDLSARVDHGPPYSTMMHLPLKSHDSCLQEEDSFRVVTSSFLDE